MSEPMHIALGDDFARSTAPARSSRRGQRRAMQAIVEQAVAKNARMRVTAAAGAVLATGLDATPREAPAPMTVAAPGIAAQPAPDGMLALGRLKAGAMNQTESAYAQHLLRLQAAGEIAWYRFEGITLKLADQCRYTPDFVVMRSDGQIELHEVKGSRGIFRDDARAKTRMAAGEFPFRVLVVYPRDRAFSGWDVEAF